MRGLRVQREHVNASWETSPGAQLRWEQKQARAAGVRPRDLRNVEGGEKSEQDAQQQQEQLEGKRREETLGSLFVIELSRRCKVSHIMLLIYLFYKLLSMLQGTGNNFVTLLKHVRSVEMTHVIGNGAALLLFLSCMDFFMLQPLLVLISNTAEPPTESLSSTTACTSPHWPPSCSLSLPNIASCK